MKSGEICTNSTFFFKKICSISSFSKGVPFMNRVKIPKIPTFLWRLLVRNLQKDVSLKSLLNFTVHLYQTPECGCGLGAVCGCGAVIRAGRFLPALRIYIFKNFGYSKHLDFFTVNTFKVKKCFSINIWLKLKKEQLSMKLYLKKLGFLDLPFVTQIKKSTLLRNLIAYR